MHILFVVPNPPSPVRVRPFHFIRALAARGHQVTVATLWANAEERADVEALRPHCARVIAVQLHRGRTLWNCARALVAGTPVQARYSLHPGLIHRMVQLQRTADVVHVEHLRAAPYALAAWERARAANRPQPVIWDSVDCISHLFGQAIQQSRSWKGRLMTRLELERTRRYEGWLVRQFAQVLVSSEIDRQALLALAAPSGAAPPPISIVSNGVDLGTFFPSSEPREPATLVITGKMSYHANVTAVLHLVRDIMPLVWAARPEVRLWVVGKDPPPALRALSSPRVTITGTVPEVRPYLQRATLAVVPLPYGAGVQNKVLEAMACGTPVVATPSAAAGLRALPERDLLVREGEQPFARAILDMLADPFRQREVGRAGRAYVTRHHNWADVGAQLELVYETMLGATSRPTIYRPAASAGLGP